MRRWANYGQIVVKKDKKEAQNVQKSEKKLKILGFDFLGVCGVIWGLL